MTGFIPSREADLVSWSTNFITLVSAAPIDFGLTAAQATAYSTLHSAFVSAYGVIRSPSTKTPSAIVAKNDAKDVLVAEARKLARIIQADPDVTNEERAELGLTVRDPEPTPVPTPAFAPNLSIVWAMGRTVRVRLRDVENPDRRGKPDNVEGATILTFVGEAPPADPAEWSFYANETRTLFDITFAAGIAAGTKVWITSFWYNAKGESGPASAPQSTRFSDGLQEAA